MGRSHLGDLKVNLLLLVCTIQQETNLPEIYHALEVFLLLYGFLFFIFLFRLLHWHPVTTQKHIAVTSVEMT